MAKKNGHEATLDTVVEAIQSLHESIRGLRDEMAKGFGRVNVRLDKAIENQGQHWRDLEQRVEALERKIG